MAHTKSAGSTKYGRDSQPKYLGVKKHDGERVQTGNIIIRQRGSHYLAGNGVKQGKDDTLFALCDGIVKFTTRKKTHFDGSKKRMSVVNVLASPAPTA